MVAKPNEENVWKVILVNKQGVPVYGALVELPQRHFSVTTNREGVFRLPLAAKGPVVVRDRAGHELAKLDTVGEDRISVDTANASLPQQPALQPLLNQQIFDNLSLAVSRFSVSPNTAQQVIDTLFCNLPPIAQLSDIIGLAEGVLQGRGADILAFRSLLQDLEVWNQRTFRYDRPVLSKEEAETVLSADYLKSLQSAMADSESEPIIPRRLMATLIGAAMLVAPYDDAIAQNRYVGVVLEQLTGLEPLLNLHSAAEAVLQGVAVGQQVFAARMQIFAPLCGGLPRPGPGPFPGPGPGPNPGPFPWPVPGGGAPWPPRPGGGFPWPAGPGGGPGRPPVGDPCLPEYLKAFREFMRRRSTYTITDITPQGACPGDVVTITGTGLLFEGEGGVVNFPTVERGVYARAEPIEWTDTTIRVAVPDAACDGVLDLEILGGADTILACDVELELFIGAADPPEFVGGQTHLLSFGVVGDTGGCFNAGERVNIGWHGCNINWARLTVTDELGEELDARLLLDGETRRPSIYIIPALRRNAVLTLRLEVAGPCGEDAAERVITVHRSLPLAVSDPFGLPGGQFENFLGNIRRNDLLIADIGPRPAEGATALERLLKAVEVTEAHGQRLGIRGSGCSYTDIVVPPGTTDRMINPDGMFATSYDLDPRLPEPFTPPPPHIVEVLARALRSDLGDEHSVLSPELLDAYRHVRPGLPVTPLRERLIHVESGIKLARLVCLLERLNLSMATLGGGVPQSLAGAIGTATHGSTLHLPPIADFVRAIHLVGPGGLQWWLEPASARITDPDQMQTLKHEGILDPCLRVRYDDVLFDAALVSFGAAGIQYSIMVEVIDEQVYQATTTQPSWPEAQRIIRSQVLDIPVPEPWFLDATLDPTGRVRLSTLELVPPDTRLREDPEHIVGEITEAIRELLLGLPRRISRELPLYIARRSLEALNPFKAGRIIREVRETVEMVTEIIRLIADITEILSSHFSHEEVAEAFPNMINLLWRMGSGMGIGRSLVDEMQNLITESERPTGTFVRKNHSALNFTSSGCPDELPDNVRAFDDPFSRLFRSSEYIVPADQAIAFANAVHRIANIVREGPEALILVINIRFTRRTRALIGMQQFPFSGHIELFTLKNLNGNDEFERLLAGEVRRFGAIPHWGQLHERTTDYDALYGRNLERWRGALDEIASASATPNTFRHEFVRNRGLLSDL